MIGAIVACFEVKVHEVVGDNLDSISLVVDNEHCQILVECSVSFCLRCLVAVALNECFHGEFQVVSTVFSAVSIQRLLFPCLLNHTEILLTVG